MEINLAKRNRVMKKCQMSNCNVIDIHSVRGCLNLQLYWIKILEISFFKTIYMQLMKNIFIKTTSLKRFSQEIPY